MLLGVMNLLLWSGKETSDNSDSIGYIAVVYIKNIPLEIL